MDPTTLVVVWSLIDSKSVCVFLAPPVDGKNNHWRIPPRPTVATTTIPHGGDAAARKRRRM